MVSRSANHIIRSLAISEVKTCMMVVISRKSRNRVMLYAFRQAMRRRVCKTCPREVVLHFRQAPILALNKQSDLWEGSSSNCIHKAVESIFIKKQLSPKGELPLVACMEMMHHRYRIICSSQWIIMIGNRRQISMELRCNRWKNHLQRRLTYTQSKCINPRYRLFLSIILVLKYHSPLALERQSAQAWLEVITS